MVCYQFCFQFYEVIIKLFPENELSFWIKVLYSCIVVCFMNQGHSTSLPRHYKRQRTEEWALFLGKRFPADLLLHSVGKASVFCTETLAHVFIIHYRNLRMVNITPMIRCFFKSVMYWNFIFIISSYFTFRLSNVHVSLKCIEIWLLE